jgi:hypothetical protein
MREYRSKYTKERLKKLVAVSRSYAQVIAALGLKQTGGTQAHLKNLIERYQINCSHFLGQGVWRGQSPSSKMSPTTILVLDRLHGRRERPSILRRALIESGLPEKCAECGSPPRWNRKHLRLQIDHKNGNPLDNRPGNPRFMCPNCHSQTENFGLRERGGMADARP